MHYVKLFNINGVDTKQVACIELQGAPNAATEGAVGVLGMDVTSPTHEVYRCVAVNGSVYTWELLSAGLSIISATISREGASSTTFMYDVLKIPTGYLLKKGDLILDSEGYLYQVMGIGSNSCVTQYSGTHLGGEGASDKDCRLVVKNGKLQLVTDSGNTLSEVDVMLPDDNTIYRDPSDGKAFVMGIKTVNDSTLRIFVGTRAEYEKLGDAQRENLIGFITDDDSGDVLAQVREDISQVSEGLSQVSKDLEEGSGIVFRAPTYNATKKLADGAGYYYIKADTGAGISHSYDLGLVYYGGEGSSMQTVVGDYNLIVDGDGKLTLFENGAIITENCSFYTAKLGE